MACCDRVWPVRLRGLTDVRGSHSIEFVGMRYYVYAVDLYGLLVRTITCSSHVIFTRSLYISRYTFISSVVFSFYFWHWGIAFLHLVYLRTTYAMACQVQSVFTLEIVLNLENCRDQTRFRLQGHPIPGAVAVARNLSRPGWQKRPAGQRFNVSTHCRVWTASKKVSSENLLTTAGLIFNPKTNSSRPLRSSTSSSSTPSITSGSSAPSPSRSPGK